MFHVDIRRQGSAPIYRNGNRYSCVGSVIYCIVPELSQRLMVPVEQNGWVVVGFRQGKNVKSQFRVATYEVANRKGFRGVSLECRDVLDMGRRRHAAT